MNTFEKISVPDSNIAHLRPVSTAVDDAIETIENSTLSADQKTRLQAVLEPATQTLDTLTATSEIITV